MAKSVVVAELFSTSIFVHWEEGLTHFSCYKDFPVDAEMTLFLTSQFYSPATLEAFGALTMLSHPDVSLFPSLSITLQSRALFFSSLDSICVSATWGEQPKVPVIFRALADMLPVCYKSYLNL